MTTLAPNPVASLTSFPRTGKRGVPQQFPRRLYEMLDSETKLAAEATVSTTGHYDKLIAWTESGRAFRIYNVKNFSETILPKYFRTKKFSSFQRNLNLYGFNKVRRGVEADAYSHPSFVRDQPDTLIHLRKVTGTSTAASTSPRKEPQQHNHKQGSSKQQSRPVSPSYSSASEARAALIHNINHSFVSSPMVPSKIVLLPALDSSSYKFLQPVSPTQQYYKDSSASVSSSDHGRLDLLTAALEREEFAAL